MQDTRYFGGAAADKETFVTRTYSVNVGGQMLTAPGTADV